MDFNTNQEGIIADERFNRFKDAPWFSKEERSVLIGGAGGIGSWLTILLTRAGMECYVYDMDIVEGHNVGGQLYGRKHVNLPKVDALNDVINIFTNRGINAFNEKYVTETMSNNYCFSAFDNMEVRKVMFDNWALNYGKEPDAIFIDGRLTLEQLTVICVQGNNEQQINDFRNKLLFADSEVEEAPCTLKQTSHTAAMIAAQMVIFFTNFLTNIAEGMPARQVPFYKEYFGPLDMVSYKPEE